MIDIVVEGGQTTHMPTIIDVAREAGVSTATVSRVLSQPDIVSGKTRSRVRAAIDQLAYQPNVAARTLRTLRAGKILVTVPDISNPFFATVIRGAEEAARDAGYAVVLGDTRHDPELENQYAEMLARKEVDGLIFLGHRLPESLAAMVASGTNSVPVINGCEYSPELKVASVHIDNQAAAADAMRHLIDLDHVRIGVVTGPLASPISRDRLAGVYDTVAERTSGSIDVSVCNGDYSVASGSSATAELLTKGVTAVFCFSDEMAIGALDAVRRFGLHCPDDVSIIGFDDIRLAAYVSPALTTISQPQVEIGRQSVQLLLKRLSGGAQELESVTLPHALVIRESTAAPGTPAAVVSRQPLGAAS